MVLKTGQYLIQSTAGHDLLVGVGKDGFLITDGEGAVFKVTKTLDDLYVMTVQPRGHGQIPPPARLFTEADGSKVIAQKKADVTMWYISGVEGTYSISVYQTVDPIVIPAPTWTVSDKGEHPITLSEGPATHQKFKFVPLPVKDGE